MAQGHLPALSACIIKNNSVVWSDGYGNYDIKNNKLANENTIYLVGSISKTVTATAMMQLWEQGLFDLDEDVNDYLPFSLRNPNYLDIPITFRMLLAHQSSLSSNFIGLFLLFSVLGLENELLPEYILPGGMLYNPKVWVDSPPGQEHTYSSIGYEILGMLVEILSGEPYIEYCKTHILEPLKMYNSSFLIEDLNKDIVSVPYVYLLTRYIRLPYYNDENYAAGGLRTNVLDLSRYLLAFMDGGEYDGTRILQEETVDMMLTYQYPNSNYGLGWKMFHRDNDSRQIGHSGGVPGGLSYMYFIDTENIGVIYLANQYLFFRINEFTAWLSLLQALFDKARQM